MQTEWQQLMENLKLIIIFGLIILSIWGIWLVYQAMKQWTARRYRYTWYQGFIDFCIPIWTICLITFYFLKINIETSKLTLPTLIFLWIQGRYWTPAKVDEWDSQPSDKTNQ